MKIFVLKSLFFLTPILVILVCVNWYGDPASLFSRSGVEYQIAKYQSEGYHVGNTFNIDQRRLQRSIISLSQTTPDAIILGSSRMMLVGSAYSNSNLFNHAVSGCSIEDMIAIFQMYKNKNEMPKKIIVGIDPWIFNENDGLDKWKSVAPEFYSFFDNHGYAEIVEWDKYSELLSPSYFQGSIKVLYNRKSSTPLPFKDREKYGDMFIRFSDGSIRYDKQYGSLSVHEVEGRIRSFTVGNIYSLENYNVFAEIDVQRFDLFIQRILSEGIEIEFLIMPYAPGVYEYFLSNPKYQIVEKFETYIREKAAIYDITVTGSLNPVPFHLSTKHFYDAMHLNEKGVSTVLSGKKF